MRAQQCMRAPTCPHMCGWSLCKRIYIQIFHRNLCLAPYREQVSGVQKKILVKIKKDGSELSLREVLDKIKELQDQNPDEDVFFDGDEYAICARPRKASP